MLTILRKSQERGDANHGWLHSKHTFSFAEYYDPQFMGFGPLRVINEDRIAGGTGFSTHGHRDMEIISYVIDGALEHKDSMGNTTIIKPGEVQRMSAGTGVRHSEYNHEKTNEAHFLQIWIMPEKNGINPSYDQKSFEQELADSKVVLVASKNGQEGSVSLNQDAKIFAAKTKKDGSFELKTQVDRKVWIQVISGQVNVSEVELKSGDAAGFEREEKLNLNWLAGSEFIIFDMVQ